MKVLSNQAMPLYTLKWGSFPSSCSAHTSTHPHTCIYLTCFEYVDACGSARLFMYAGFGEEYQGDSCVLTGAL